MAPRTSVSVKMHSDYSIATDIFAPSGSLVRRAWNRTQQVAAQARRTAPMKTGALRASIYPRKSSIYRPDRPVYEVVAGNGGSIRYAAPQEYGYTHWRSGRFIPGKHFLREANRSVRW